MTSKLRIHILGPLVVEHGDTPIPASGWRSQQERRLLAILLARRGRHTPSERFVEWLWPGAEHSAAARTLRSAVSSLRHTLEPHAARASSRYIVTQPGGYVWNTGSGVWIDAEEFAALTEPPAAQTKAAERAGQLARAVQLYRGDFLEDEPEAAWLLASRDRLRDRLTYAVEELAQHYVERGEYAAAVAAVRRGLAFVPLCEPLWRQLMHVQQAMGDAAGALSSYEYLRHALDGELGAMPSAQTQALHTAILQGVPSNRQTIALSHATPETSAPARALVPGQPDAPPLVGRRRELITLQEHLTRLERGRGATITLVGEGGIGKSHLALETLRAAAGGGAQTIVLRCAPLERDLPFAPLGEPLRRLIRTAPDGLLRGLPASNLVQVAALLPALRDRLPHLPVAVPVPPAEQRNQLLGALTELALLTARVDPLIVLCDDAQWADEATLALLGRLARRAPRHPLLVILAYRSEELAENRALHTLLRELGRDTLVVPLLLGPLNVEETAELVAALGRVEPHQVTKLAPDLAADTGGNPLYITVAVQAMREHYGAASLQPILEAIAAGAPVPVPHGAPAIRDLVLGRLERLAPPARELAEQIAVIARPVSLDLVDHIAPEAGLSAAQLLLDRQLLVENADGRIGFAHELVRSVVAEALASPRRRLLHRQAALAIAALHAQRPGRAAEIAYHLARAGRGHDAGLLAFATTAGDEARRGLAFAAALDQYGVALAAADRLGATASSAAVEDAFSGQLMTYESLLDWDGVAATIERYARWATGRPDVPATLVSPRRLIVLRALTGDLAGAAEMSRRQITGDGAQAPVLTDLFERTARILEAPEAWVVRDEHPGSEHSSDLRRSPFTLASAPPGRPAVDVPILLGPAEASTTLFLIGWATLAQGLVHEALPCLQRAYDLAVEASQPAAAVASALQLAHLCDLIGDAGETERWLTLSLHTAERAPQAAWISIWPLIHQGFLWLESDEHGRAHERFRAMETQLVDLPSFQAHRAGVEVGLGLVALRHGALDDARQRLRAALREPRALYGFVYVAALHGWARLAAQRGEVSMARATLAKAMAYSARRQLLPEYTRTVLEICRVERDHGDPRESLPLLDEVVELTTRVGLTAQAAAALALRGRIAS